MDGYTKPLVVRLHLIGHMCHETKVLVKVNYPHGPVMNGPSKRSGYHPKTDRNGIFESP